jgi:hypothetical protein
MFEAPWTFNAAFKSLKSRGNWDDNEATVTLKMQKRAIGTLDGESPFEYFDGADMQTRLPSKGSEAVFCRQDPTTAGCEGGHGFDPFRPNIRRDMVKNSTDFDLERELDVDGGAYLMLEAAVHQLSLGAKTEALVAKFRVHSIFEVSSLSHLDSFQNINSRKPSVRVSDQIFICWYYCI